MAPPGFGRVGRFASRRIKIESQSLTKREGAQGGEPCGQRDRFSSANGADGAAL